MAKEGENEPPYSVAIDPATLKPWDQGANEFLVELIGDIDTRWVENYVLVRRRSTSFSRFNLNQAKKRVIFSCRGTDGPAQIARILGNLQLLIEHTNRRAEGATRPTEGQQIQPGEPSGRAAPAAPMAPRPTSSAPLETSESAADRVRGALEFSLQALGRTPPEGTTIPFVGHLMSTAALVLEDGGNEDEVVAALLAYGDAPERASQSLEEIRNRFGEIVGLIAQGCEEAYTALRPPDGEGARERYVEYLGHALPAVRRVVCAAKLSKARSLLAQYRRLAPSQRSAFREINRDDLRYYRQLAGAFVDAAQTGHLIEELDSVILELELGAGSEAPGRQPPPGSEPSLSRLTEELAERLDQRLRQPGNG